MTKKERPELIPKEGLSERLREEAKRLSQNWRSKWREEAARKGVDPYLLGQQVEILNLAAYLYFYPVTAFSEDPENLNRLPEEADYEQDKEKILEWAIRYYVAEKNGKGLDLKTLWEQTNSQEPPSEKVQELLASFNGIQL